jgi:TRAP-type C4-dicarboxylate transport system substrate-binding protein
MTKYFGIKFGHSATKFSAMVAVAIACAFGAGQASAEKFKLVTGWPQNFPFYEEVGPRFIELVKKQAGTEITITVSGPDTVPSFEQLQPVQAGVFDMLYTHGAYHSGTSGIGLAVDAVVNDPVRRRTEGIFDFVDKHYQAKGLKLIALPSLGTKGFGLYLREPITGVPGLKGRKLRGTVSYHPMIKALGGVPVNLPPGDIYTGLQRGTVDGAAWALVGAEAYKWDEVIKYIAKPTFGQLSLMILMNLDRWNSLPPKMKAAITEAGRLIEIESIGVFDKLQVAEEISLLKKGMMITEFKPEEASRFDKMFSDGVWTVAAQASKVDAEKLRALAKSKGMGD